MENEPSTTGQRDKTEHTNGQPLTIFFDGECNLCSGSVQFILKRDPEERFRFASLQGVTGQQLLASHQFSKEKEIDYAIEQVKNTVTQLRELSPLWEMHKEGNDVAEQV